MNTKEIIRCAVEDEHKLCVLSKTIEDLLSECEDPDKYENSFHILMYGPHHTKDTLEESEVTVKYDYDDIQKIMSTSGIALDECITPEDIVYTVNSLYKTYYPLIPDLIHAVKFAEKYLREDYPIRGGRAYMEWKCRCGK